MSSSTSYSTNTKHTIPARLGVAVPLKVNQSIKVINTHGTQVVDTWAVVPSEPIHHMSMPHVRATTEHLSPYV